MKNEWMERDRQTQRRPLQWWSVYLARLSLNLWVPSSWFSSFLEFFMCFFFFKLTDDCTHENLNPGLLCCIPSLLHLYDGMYSARQRNRWRAGRCHTPIKDKKCSHKGLCTVITSCLTTAVKQGTVTVAPKRELPFFPHIHTYSKHTCLLQWHWN